MALDIRNCDCMELMSQFPNKHFDLAIVDPPYGIGEDGRKNHTRSVIAKAKNYSKNARYDNSPPDFRYFQELFRVSKNQIIWGGNYYIEFLKNTPCVIVWDKDNGENDFADCEIAWTSFKTAARKFKWRWQGMLQEDMKNKQERIHPNEKPIALYKWLLKNYAKEGHSILDTHGGSMSLAIACHDYSFDLTVCEIDKEYYEKAMKRINNHVAQTSLF